MNENEQLTYSPHGLLSQALAQNVPIETLERLMDLQERWDAKQAKSAYLNAMSKFQSLCPVFKKNKKVNYPSKSGGGNVKYNYTELGSITKTIQPFLEECGLSYRWEFEDLEDKIKCDCVISHVAGHSERCSMRAGKDSSGNKNDIQSIGSTRTYLQRYTLIGGLGLSTADEDNDGNIPEPGKGKKEEIPEPKSINKNQSDNKNQPDKIETLISAITSKTKAESLSKLDSMLGNEESLAKRKRYVDLFQKQLDKVGNKYQITTILK
jgi:hypothetical protein